MNIVFRVDASDHIGSGHLMRCLTLSNRLAEDGASICFISRHMPVGLREMILHRGYEFMALPEWQTESAHGSLAHSAWLGVSQSMDADDSLAAISNRRWHWLIVDHYALDASWERRFRNVAENILAIDDIADREHDCDILLDQNYYNDMHKRYDGKLPSHCRALLGPDYALLRDEFRQLRNKVQPRSGEVRHLLVFFGGVDADNCTARIIDILGSINIQNLHVDVVIGGQHPHCEQVQQACEKNRFVCHVQTRYMAELVAGADLAIGASGSATWERCCLGLPTLMMSLSDNQVAIANAIADLGAGVYMGKHNLIDDVSIRDAIIELLHNRERLQQMSKLAYSLVDGLGVERVRAAMIN